MKHQLTTENGDEPKQVVLWGQMALAPAFELGESQLDGENFEENR